MCSSQSYNFCLVITEISFCQGIFLDFPGFLIRGSSSIIQYKLWQGPAYIRAFNLEDCSYHCDNERC